MATKQIRQMVLPDGRVLTWLHVPVVAGGGRILSYDDVEGTIDGEAISDEKLHRLKGLRPRLE